jgi:hypothetical protein
VVEIAPSRIAPPDGPKATEMPTPRKAAASRKASPVIAEPPLPDDPGPDREVEAAEETPRFKLF